MAVISDMGKRRLSHAMLDTHWMVAKQLSVAVDVGAQIHHTAKVSYAFTTTLTNQNFNKARNIQSFRRKPGISL